VADVSQTRNKVSIEVKNQYRTTDISSPSGGPSGTPQRISVALVEDVKTTQIVERSDIRVVNVGASLFQGIILDPATVSHTLLQDIGSNTHVAIDSHIVTANAHIADASIHYAMASIDHGTISGLADDDHTQYFRADGTRTLAGPLTQNTGDVNFNSLQGDYDFTINGLGKQGYKYDSGLDYHLWSGDWESDVFKYLSATTGNSECLFIGEDVGVNNTGLNNTGIGSNALNANTTGINNIAIGTFALLSNVDGQNNVGIGKDALRLNVSGSDNFALGVGALYNNTGEDNIAFGRASLYSNTTGANNVGIGRSTLNSNTTGKFGVAIGNSTLTNSVDGWYNVGIGYRALRDVTSGAKNVAIGGLAGYSAGSGDLNVFLGHNAGYFWTGSNALFISNSDTTTPLIYGEFDTGDLKFSSPTVQDFYSYDGGLEYHYFKGDWESDVFKYQNTTTGATNAFAIGPSAGTGTGEGNYSWGTSAGGALTTGTFNTFIGHQSGQLTTTGFYNVGLGFRTLQDNVSGTRNVGIGYLALTNATGSYNLAIGGLTGSAITTGQYNVLIGSGGATALTTGNNNFVLGALSAQALVSGGNNIILGADSARTAHNKNNLVAIGWQAGRNANSASSLFLGREAGYSENTDQRLHIANNQTESLMYGEFDTRYLQINGILKPEANRSTVSLLTTSTTLTHTITHAVQTTSGITTQLWATPTAGDHVEIRNRSGGSCTISGGAETIEGSTTITLYDGETADLIYANGEWKI